MKSVLLLESGVKHHSPLPYIVFIMVVAMDVTCILKFNLFKKKMNYAMNVQELG
jgi:hypothetical protein